MNNKLITAVCLALILAGCSDKNDTASTGSAEPGMMDKAMESTSGMASDAYDATTETAGDMAEGASDMASDAVDATKETIHDAAQGTADATAPAPEEATTDEASDAMGNTGGAMGE